MKKKVFILFGVVVVFVSLFSILMMYIQMQDTFEERVFYDAGLGGDYLVRNFRDDGSYMYLYEADTNTVSDSYNMLRHSGTTYALFELYEATNKKTYLETANKAIEYLKTTISPCPKEYSNLLCVYDGNETKLGGNALAILAFLKQFKITGDTAALGMAIDLAAWIKRVQTSEGEFSVHIQKRDGKIDDHVSEYYPGEAVYALMSLYKATGDKEWVQVAKKAATWLIEVRDVKETVETILHDHWLLYGLRELYFNTHDEKYLEHAKVVVDGIIANQHVGGVEDDWIGGYYTPPRSTPTATRSEGLAAAYTLFTEAGDVGYANKAYEALQRGVAFQLRTFIDSERSGMYPEPLRSLGGFRESLTEDAVRIDYVQHNISSLLMFWNISKSRAVH